MNATIVTRPARPGVIATLLVLVGTVVFMSTFLGLYKLLGVGVPYMGVLFLLYWAAMQQMRFSVYLASVTGAVIGVLLAWMLSSLSIPMGLTGTILAYGALGAILFCYTRGQATLIANNGTLLFVLVGSVPELQVTHNVGQMVLSVLLGAAFMGIVAWILKLIQDRRQSA